MNEVFGEGDPYGGHKGSTIAWIIFGGIFVGAAVVIALCFLFAYLFTGGADKDHDSDLLYNSTPASILVINK